MQDVFQKGAGPFVTPLLAEFHGAQLADGLGHCILEFAFEDGAKLLAPISIRAAESLNLALTVWLSKQNSPRGEKH